MASFHVPFILFTYPESVIGRRMDWYLTLRRIPYVHCRVNYMMPRPVLERLGVRYRWIPVLAIGRDIYCDSRCIIETLERLYTETPRLGVDAAVQPYERGIERLIENWAFEGGVFWRTAQLITPDAKLVQDPKFLEDRFELTQRRFSADELKALVPDALSAARIHLQLVEDDLLGDGRKWISGSARPGLVDVNLLWAFDWMWQPPERMGMAHYHSNVLDEKKWPKVHAWIMRMRKLYKEERDQQGELEDLDEDKVVMTIESAGFFESERLHIEDEDPTGLKTGDMTDLIPTDVPSGPQHKDTGELVGLTITRATIGTETKNGIDVRIHYTRTNVRVAAASSGKE